MSVAASSYRPIPCQWLLALMILLFSTSLMGASLPPEFVAKYDIKKGFVTLGEAIRKLEKAGDHWRYVSDSRTTGFLGALVSEHIIQVTDFEIKNNLIRPLIYRYDRNKGKKTVLQTYDWENHRVISRRDDKVSEYAIPTKVQDQSIYQLSLMLDLADGLRDFTYHVAENVRLVDYKIQYLGTKKLKSRLGRFKTIVVQVKTKNNKTTIWCAPSLHFLPIKIEFIEDGTSFTAWLKEIRGFQ